MGATEQQVDEALEGDAGWAEDWFDGELPQHAVYVDGYWIDQLEVSNEQYTRFIEAGGYDRREFWTDPGWEWRERVGRMQPQYWDDPKWTAPDLPVVGVVWFEALAYCRWAGARLLTDAEWEKAAGWDPVAEIKHTYPWGDQWNPERANTRESGVHGLAPVDAYCPEDASPVGACNMAGNVWEWCSSSYRPYPYDPSDGREDSEAPETRVLRGGSWVNAKEEARTTYRLPPFPGDFILFDPSNGFRCAMSDN
jgi:iron(II)-dependent oxidoreductase